MKILHDIHLLANHIRMTGIISFCIHIKSPVSAAVAKTFALLSTNKTLSRRAKSVVFAAQRGSLSSTEPSGAIAVRSRATRLELPGGLISNEICRPW